MRQLSERTRAKKGEAGFSLIELLVVLAILALLIGLVAPRVVGYLGRSKSQTAAAQVSMIESSLDLMLIDIGRYPTQEEGLDLLVRNSGNVAGWAGPYLRDGKVPVDPWGRAYLFRFDSSGDVAVYSLGADGEEGGSDENADIGLN